MRGKDPQEWCETAPLGPFESEMKARKAIREDVESSLEDCQMLSPGNEDDYCESYHLLEYVKSFQPLLKVDVAITLSNAKVRHGGPDDTE